MSKKERYFQTTKPKKYTDLITKEFKQLEVGSIVTLSFINNDLKIKPSSSVLLKMMYGFKELKNYEVLQTIKAPQSFVGDEVINVKPGTILATLVSPGGLQVVEDEVQISDEGTEQTELVSNEDDILTPEEIEEVQTRKQILSIKPTDKKNAKYLQFADTPMYPSEFVERIGQEKYDEFVKNGKITPVSFS
jgi:hypothetical protein